MKFFVNVLKDGRVITLKVDPAITILNIKKTIQGKTDIPLEEQRLVFAGKLLDDGHTLADIGVKEKSSLDLVHLRHDVMFVFVRSISTGKTITLEVSPAALVKDIKQRICDKLGIQITDRQRLNYNHQQLDDNHCLSSYDVHNESTFDVETCILLFVEMMNSGNKFTLLVSFGDTIEYVKEQIQEKEGISSDLQRIVYCSKTLENGRSLSDYCISDGNEISVFHRHSVSASSAHSRSVVHYLSQGHQQFQSRQLSQPHKKVIGKEDYYGRLDRITWSNRSLGMMKEPSYLQVSRVDASVQADLHAESCVDTSVQADYHAIAPVSRVDASVQTDLHAVSCVDTSVQADYLAIAPDSLRGVEVFSETVLLVEGDKSQKLVWSGYGFYLEVPDGALPPGVVASVGIKVILAGQFTLPDNYQLISAIYWISSSEMFLKEVAVNIQHCATIKSDDDCSKFKFIIAKCSQKVLPYNFREREGVFNSHTQYATIKLKQFSLLGEVAPNGTEYSYTALKFYKQIAGTSNVDFMFVIVNNLEPCLKSVENQHKDWKQDKPCQIIYFSDPVVTLGLPDSAPLVINCWEIVPRTPPQISKSDVDSFKPGLAMPSCLLELVWTKSDPPQQGLRHKVILNGAKPPAFFYIRHDPSTADRSDDITVDRPNVPSISDQVNLRSLTCLKYKDEQGHEQRIYILDQMAPQWKVIGALMLFSNAELRNIATTCRDDSVDCCREVVSLWLEGHNDSCSKTWTTLLELMHDARLGELAQTVRSILQPAPQQF